MSKSRLTKRLAQEILERKSTFNNSQCLRNRVSWRYEERPSRKLLKVRNSCVSKITLGMQKNNVSKEFMKSEKKNLFFTPLLARQHPTEMVK
jgi:hypothetical protein